MVLELATTTWAAEVEVVEATLQESCETHSQVIKHLLTPNLDEVSDINRQNSQLEAWESWLVPNRRLRPLGILIKDKPISTAFAVSTDHLGLHKRPFIGAYLNALTQLTYMIGP